MRADRLVAMLLSLQHHGRMTAAQLAGELQVSVRTVLRDVEALSAAGVPVYTVQGAGGGVELLDGFQTRLSGVTEKEAGAILLAGQPAVAAALGMGVAAHSTRRKLLQALSPSLAAAAGALDGWFLQDPFGRAGADSAGDQIPLLVRAIELSLEVRLVGTGTVAPHLRPLALVLETGRWQLVHLGPEGPLALALHDPAARVVLGRRFTRPADFDLAAFWQARREG